ncbi:Autophagy-related protein [Erysiphe necator]|nr:Autophagy-related protein [Erysiphe necator]
MLLSHCNMLSPNILSHILPTRATRRSIYEELRAHDADEHGSDIEAQTRLTLDEENLQLQGHELDYLNMTDDRESPNAVESTHLISHSNSSSRAENVYKGENKITQPKWMIQSPRFLPDDGDEDVPASLLVEEQEMTGPSTIKNISKKPTKAKKHSAQWEFSPTQKKMQANIIGKPSRKIGFVTSNAREKALWHWINITNLDNFIRDLYDYYTGAGIWCILLERTLNLVQVVFVASFTTFLTQCVEFQNIPGSKKLSEILVPQCTKKISGIASLAIWLFTFHVFWRVCQLIADIPHLLRVREFYIFLLEIPEIDMQTISWQDVVARIMTLRDANPITAEDIPPSNRRFIGSQSKQRLDAHDIANRLMRRENYLIALFNKDILDLTLPIPFLKARQLFSRTLLWNIDQCIMDLVFNDEGQVRQVILKESHRKQLSDALRRRFMFAGFMNALLAPMIIVYLMIVYFLRYFNEYQKNPAAVGSRQYTPLALWKFREFNELQHLFEKRVNMSYPFASRYLDQFPKVKVTQVARFVAFCAGAIVSVLAVLTFWDPEMLTNFEITSDRPVVFYIGVLGAIWALTNGMLPEENLVFEPEFALQNVIDYIHYMPNHWHNRLHSDDVKTEFAQLYKLKIVIFIEEVFSIIFTPFILWFSLPKCSNLIIDFFREFTVHVDGVGYVCSFAVFDFKKNGRCKPREQASRATDAREDYYSTKHGKMTASYYGFIDNYLLNPRSTARGHIPLEIRQKYYPPPPFPGLMSPAFAPEIQNSRVGRSIKRHGSCASQLRPINKHIISPLHSILLDPHHQPSNSGSGRLTSRHRNRTRQIISKEPAGAENQLRFKSERNIPKSQPYESVMGLGESRWETSPPRTDISKAGEEDEDLTSAGVLGMLYQFQRTHKDGKCGVDI